MIAHTHERDKIAAMNILDIAIQAESGVSNLARSIGVTPNVIGNWKNRKVPKAWGQLLQMKYGANKPSRKPSKQKAEATNA